MQIVHFTQQSEWEAANETGFYTTDSLKSQGFIHCSKPDQVLRVANANVCGIRGLVLLVIDETKVNAQLIYENLEGGPDPFPHIYGPLNIDAVISVHPFVPGPEGCFELPSDLSNSTR